MKNTLWILAISTVVLAAVFGCASQEPASESATESSAERHDEPALTAENAVMMHEDETHVTLWVTSDGFVPASVHVPGDKPVHLTVTRKTEKTCATELVMPAYDIDQELPLNEAVDIRFTPKASGTVSYACGMDMLKGEIIVD